MRTPTALLPRSRPLLVAFLVVLVDEVTKTAARMTLPLCEVHGCARTRLLGILELARVHNAGSALGFVQGLWLWTLVAAAGLIVAVAVATRSSDRAVVLGAALLAGGGVANLADRVVAGAVTDFISGGPVVFNLADVALAIGCVAMTLGLHRQLWVSERIDTQGGGSGCSSGS